MPAMPGVDVLADCPVIVAPMAGGPTTPQLVAAAATAGAFGFLAAGYKSAADVEHEVRALRALSERPFGVNVFLVTPTEADSAELGAFRASLGEGAGEPRSDDDGFAEKVERLLADPAPVVSFTFGCPEADLVERFHAAGSEVWVTVTTVDEARLAAAAGADALVTKDAALLELGRKAPFRIVTPAQLGLLLAYRGSDYVVFDPKVVFHVGEPNPALDELLESHGERTAAFVTASNPRSKPRPKEENQAANQRLLESQRLLSRTCLEGEGRAPDGSWAERSFLILGISLPEAEALGRAWGQNAVVFCEKARPPALVLIDL